MSNPTMNHTSHTLQKQQQQQQQQQLHGTPPAHSNLVNSTSMTLPRSDSTSTVILEDEEIRPTPRRIGLSNLPPSVLASLSTTLRSLLKTSGQFNNNRESIDKLSDLFASGDEFTLQRFLSEMGANDANLDVNDFLKLDSGKGFDSRTLSEFIRSESFDQLIASSAHLAELSSTPLALPCSSASFSELRSLSPEFLTQEMLPEQSKMETETPVTYTRMKSLSHLPIDTSVPTTVSPQFTASQRTLDAVDHDHAFLYKRQPTGDTASTSEEQPGRRSSSRIQSRTTCSSSSSTSSGRAKRSKNVNRAKDVETSDDLSYYLERRRKNNEASKASRAVRRQKFESMDERCEEYERVNAELRTKISTLEAVTTKLKSGLINNFQRKGGESSY